MLSSTVMHTMSCTASATSSLIQTPSITQDLSMVQDRSPDQGLHRLWEQALVFRSLRGTRPALLHLGLDRDQSISPPPSTSSPHPLADPAQEDLKLGQEHNLLVALKVPVDQEVQEVQAGVNVVLPRSRRPLPIPSQSQ